MNALSFIEKGVNGYVTPSMTVLSIEVRQVLCESTAPGGTEDFREGNDWDFEW